jgi:hypothetical protein
MEDMSAMNYEYLIRRAYQEGRYGTKGANADIFRGLIREQWVYKSEKEAIDTGKPRKSTKPIEKLEETFRKKADEVKSFIAGAIDHALKKYGNKFSEAQKDGLESCKQDLNTYAIETIEQVIERADKIILEIGLYPQ